MTRDQINEKVNEIFQDVFDDKNIVVNNETTSSDVEDWDSFSHMTLISEIESEFGINFDMKDVVGMKNVGEMQDIIDKKTNNK